MSENKIRSDEAIAQSDVDCEVIKHRIYVASSWRNELQPKVVKTLKTVGHKVYDFRNPTEGNKGFHWGDIDWDWRHWSMEKFREALKHSLAEEGFRFDYSAMEWADVCVLVMPCGRSAHLEAGYFNGAKKKLYILLSDGEPELMYKMADNVFTNIDELIGAL